MHPTNERRIPAAIWLLAVMMLALAVATPARIAAAQISTPAAGEDGMYYDPGNRFAVPVPTNWVAEEHNGYVSIVTNDKKISISIAVIDGPSATAAITQTMRMLDPAFAATPIPELAATPSSGSDEIALYTYDDGSGSGRLLQAFGRRIGDHVYVLVLDGDLATVKLRQVQVDKIQQGILINAAAGANPVATPAS